MDSQNFTLAIRTRLESTEERKKSCSERYDYYRLRLIPTAQAFLACLGADEQTIQRIKSLLENRESGIKMIEIASLLTTMQHKLPRLLQSAYNLDEKLAYEVKDEILEVYDKLIAAFTASQELKKFTKNPEKIKSIVRAYLLILSAYNEFMSEIQLAQSLNELVPGLGENFLSHYNNIVGKIVGTIPLGDATEG